jgi:hypothetical protein
VPHVHDDLAARDGELIVAATSKAPRRVNANRRGKALPAVFLFPVPVARTPNAAIRTANRNTAARSLARSVLAELVGDRHVAAALLAHPGCVKERARGRCPVPSPLANTGKKGDSIRNVPGC